MNHQARIVETDTGREVYLATGPDLADLQVSLDKHWNTLDSRVQHAIEIDSGSGWGRVAG